MFHRLSMAPAYRKPEREDDILRRRLQMYRIKHGDPKIRQACDIILENIDRLEALRYKPIGDNKEVRALQLALARKMGGDERDCITIIEEIKALLDNDIF